MASKNQRTRLCMNWPWRWQHLPFLCITARNNQTNMLLVLSVMCMSSETNMQPLTMCLQKIFFGLIKKSRWKNYNLLFRGYYLHPRILVQEPSSSEHKYIVLILILLKTLVVVCERVLISRVTPSLFLIPRKLRRNVFMLMVMHIYLFGHYSHHVLKSIQVGSTIS